MWKILIGVMFAGVPSASELKSAYPHWPTDDASLQQLRTIEDFARSQGGEGRAAFFDWDGTLYSEKIRINNPPAALRHAEKLRAGQPACNCSSDGKRPYDFRLANTPFDPWMATMRWRGTCSTRGRPE